MTHIVEASFDGKVFLPVKDLDLEPNRKYTLIVQDSSADMSMTSAWDVLDALKGTVVAPDDWSVEHDHYVYGTPKKSETSLP